MGVCGSKDTAGRAPTRDLSNWKVSEQDSGDGASAAAAGTRASPSNAYSSDRTGAATASSEHVQLSVSARDLALNCVATHASFAETQTCVTGWEDGSIQKLCWAHSGAAAVSLTASATDAVVDVWKPHERAVNRVVVGRSAELLYSCSRDTTVALTSHLSTGSSGTRKPQSVLLRGHSLNVSTIAVNDAETALCSGGRDTQTIFWDLHTGTLKAKNTTPQNVVTCSKWVPREPLVVQGSEDLTLKVWDERTPLRAPAQSFRGYVYFALSVDVSPDATYVLTSSKGFNGVGCEVRVWDRRSAKQLYEFTGHQQDATSCCFLPASSIGSGGSDDASGSVPPLPIPVSASKDGSVKLWDATTARVRCEAREPSAGMFTSLCAVDSATLLASTFSGEVHAFAFDAHTSQLQRIDRLCGPHEDR